MEIDPEKEVLRRLFEGNHGSGVTSCGISGVYREQVSMEPGVPSGEFESSV